MGKKHKTAEQVAGEVKGDVAVIEKAEKKGRKVQLTPPPAPMAAIGEVTNPLIGNKGLKRALAVAIALQCKTDNGKIDEVKAGLLIRASGICFKAGYKPEAATDPLTQNEWSGRPYANWAVNSPAGKVYPTKHPEKVQKVEAFAKALVDAVVDVTVAPVEVEVAE